jgi:hypothetical protein
MAITKVTRTLLSTGIDDQSNATAITIDSSENVGIGTASPSTKLDVYGSDPRIQSSNSTATVKNILLAGGTAGYTGMTTNHPLVFITNDTEAMRIDSSGNVGIGTTSPLALLDVAVLSSGARRLLVNYADSIITLQGANSSSTNESFRVTGDNLRFATGSGTGTERMRIDSSGNVGIGTTSPSRLLDIENTSGDVYISLVSSNTIGTSGLLLGDADADYAGRVEYYNSSNAMALWTSNAERMRIDSSGNVGIGLTAPTTKLHIGDNDHLGFGTGSATKPDFRISFVTATNSLGIKCGTGGDAVDVTLSVTGDLTIAGALSKGSGSFRIDHPLESKKDTHHLVHSFVEAPQADNIYRGKVDLVDGSATVNIDTVAGMTEGTFVALNTDVQCFTTNESDWDAVKGSVSGNILTISCQNTSSTATISWLVIGERQDQHMLDTEWTDENGKVIVEPEKEIE